MENDNLLINQFGWAGVIMLALATYIVRRDSSADLTRKEQEARLDRIYAELFAIQKDTVKALEAFKAEMEKQREVKP